MKGDGVQKNFPVCFKRMMRLGLSATICSSRATMARQGWLGWLGCPAACLIALIKQLLFFVALLLRLLLLSELHVCSCLRGCLFARPAWTPFCFLSL